MHSTGISKLFTAGALTLAGMFLVTGCKTVGPDFEKPEVPVADTWLDAENEKVDTSSVVYQDWWKVFNDPALTSLIDTAYQQNLSLQVAGLRVMEARAQLGIATGLKYPQSQSVGGGYAYTRSSINAPPLSNLPDEVLQGVDRTNGAWSASFDAAWEADVWGKFRRGVEAADATLAASMLNYDAVLVTLTGDVAALYTTIRTLDERLAFARSNVDLQRQALDLANTRFKLGATSELDVQQARGLLYNTEALIPAFELSMDRTQNTLSFLLGMPPSDLESLLGTSGKIPGVPESVAVGIPADLLRRRPDVRAAEMAAAAQSAAIGISQADLYPSFVLAGSIGVAGSSFRISSTPLQRPDFSPRSSSGTSLITDASRIMSGSRMPASSKQSLPIKMWRWRRQRKYRMACRASCAPRNRSDTCRAQSPQRGAPPNWPWCNIAKAPPTIRAY